MSNTSGKNTFYVSCPIDTYSGYGARSRDFVRALIELDEYDVKIISQRWGSTSTNFIMDHFDKWGFLKEHIINYDTIGQVGNLMEQPDIWCQITVPNEFMPHGKFNIGLTAGIETSICAPQWIEGNNRMDLILASSVHSRDVLLNTSYRKKDKQTGQESGEVRVKVPMEVLIEGADLETFKIVKNQDLKLTSLKDDLNSIPEKFAFLCVGHWMHGDLGHDRKNIGLTVKWFYELFRGIENPPALILKCSLGNSSYLSRREIMKRLHDIRSMMGPGKKFPHIYLLHGDFTDDEMNELYNHHKVKSMISLTKGEGFGRPLLEFSLTGKPIIVSNWSGQVDFMHGDYTTLIPGKLEKLHPSSVMKDMLLEQSEWFSPDENSSKFAMTDVFRNYKSYKEKSKKQKEFSEKHVSFHQMKTILKKYLDHYVPKNIPKKIGLNLSGLEDIKITKKPKKEKVNG